MALAASTFYEYFTEGGITAGLSDSQPYFTLNDKNITLYSGAFHYFRVPRAYWRDRLKKMRAAGLNTVETYVPWNLHEYQSGVYDFGDGGSDMEDFLNVEEFLKTAQEEDLFALVRPGPYICAEWEFGGLPSWILRNTSSVRNSKDDNYLSIVKRYFGVLLPILAALQFQKGGPIIGLQIENEYGNTGESDTDYLVALQQMYIDNGITELLYTSDPPSANGKGAVPGVLQTANYNSNPQWQLDKLNSLQSNKPTMTMEYWTGWFDHWTEDHHTVSTSNFKGLLEQILDYPSSVNMYTFVGSTNFGFLNGASSLYSGMDNHGLQPVTNSYDYDAPLTEYGDYTEKYDAVKEVIAARNTIPVSNPDPPASPELVAYESIRVDQVTELAALIDNSQLILTSEDVIPMEMLPINDNSGQSFGYVVYRKTGLDIPANAVLKIGGYVRDTVLVLINGNLVSGILKEKSDLDNFGFWKVQDSTLTLTDTDMIGATLDLVVENCGRNNYGSLDQFRQFKGLTDPVYINDEQLSSWQIVPLQFKRSDNLNLKSLSSWRSRAVVQGPALYKATLTIDSDPKDTFVDLRDWTKGIVIVNGYVLGRHFFLGPQQTLYLPASPFLQKGDNEIIIFEHYAGAENIKFVERPVFVFHPHLPFGSARRDTMTLTRGLSRQLRFFAVLLLCLRCSSGGSSPKEELPTLYEYYVGDEITSGLSDDQPYFTLNNKNITLYSGAFHYFRVPRAYWRDRLRKIRAAGLNTVETYVPWNLHEPKEGQFDFGGGGSAMEDFLHLFEFLTTAQEEDLFVVLRPGPFICAEWEFGGLPSWLLRETSSVRTSKDDKYIYYVRRYFSILLSIMAPYQFQNNGPIIGFQIENEYANTGENDTAYLVQLQQMFLDNGIVELLYTSDSPRYEGVGAIPGVLQTANLDTNVKELLDKLNTLQTNKPTMVMEYWTGSYDYWTEDHNGVDVDDFQSNLVDILDYPASVNLYMFIGGTNYRYLNGANTLYSGTNNSGYEPITSSYDYDAPITEYGNYTEKYNVVKELIAARNPVKTKLPDPPETVAAVTYPSIALENMMTLATIYNNMDDRYQIDSIIPMELLPTKDNSGQSFGYILYRKTGLYLAANAVLKISGYVRDTVMVLLDDISISPSPTEASDLDGFGFWRLENSTIALTSSELQNVTLELLVENFGRNNYGALPQFRQFKGLTDPVYIDDQEVTDWEAVPMEFNGERLYGWLDGAENRTNVPAAYRGSLLIYEDEPQDTFLDMREWTKGIVMVNGFIIGRYFFLGPQQTLYLPAPLMVRGTNDVIIFEHYNAPENITFSDKPIFEGPSH
ncbi:hypothetical protein NQ318_014405 [Aromia moschata]|uniref:Beta-galactosidase n=1 Tax=Aromia moschata TaxID=1265417 RepID=A0AAV8XP10_9CUCU|nr:hypothetical protein NQ318_014405 [Aromia moschata]